jgi:hypothetical protein
MALTSIIGWILAIYLGTSPVYWFWALPIEFVAGLKAALVCAGVILTWSYASIQDRLKLPVGLSGIPGVTLLLLSLAPALVQSDVSAALIRVQDVIVGFLMLWTVYLFGRIGGDVRQLFLRAAFLISCFCAFTVSYALTGFPDWVNPFILRDSQGLEAPVLSYGFGAHRTGWANGVCLFFPIALFALGGSRRLGRRRDVFLLTLAICLQLGSQIISGGRAGSLASFLCLSLFILRERRALSLIMLVVLASTITLLDQDWLVSHLRYDRVKVAQDVMDLDQFSASRIGQYPVAISLIAESPLFGHGILAFEDLGFGQEIHNVWLRLAVHGGIFAPIILASIFASLLLRAIKTIRLIPLCEKPSIEIRSFLVALLSVLCVALVPSMLEPSIILGVFHKNALWWAAAGAISFYWTEYRFMPQRRAEIVAPKRCLA